MATPADVAATEARELWDDPLGLAGDATWPVALVGETSA